MLVDSAAQYFIFLLPVFLMVMGFLCISFWFSKQDFISVLWLGLATTSHGIAFFIQSLFSMEHQYQVYWLFLVFYLLNYIFFTQAVVLRFGLKVNWLWFLGLLVIAELIILYFSFMSNNYAARLLTFAISIMLIVSIYSIKIYFKPSLSRIHDYLKIAFYACTFIFIARVFLLTQYSLNNQAALLNFQSTSHWFLNQIFILVLTMIYAALIIAAHLYEAYRQQQTDILQAKKQERVYLTQDLHDTLGSSLVRSIGEIGEQQQALNSSQVLAMLKVFRDDLRQVIDHNTHHDAASMPATPIIWGAPIRHRFSQVFESLNIQCTWHFDPVWQQPPSSLTCVHLRRITEEALTNIIKHSQATQVTVQLAYHQDQLQLSIQDNGVGFHLNQTMHNSINVGLNSMQQRAKSIGAYFEINSSPALTHILLRLPSN